MVYGYVEGHQSVTTSSLGSGKNHSEDHRHLCRIVRCRSKGKTYAIHTMKVGDPAEIVRWGDQSSGVAMVRRGEPWSRFYDIERIEKEKDSSYIQRIIGENFDVSPL